MDMKDVFIERQYPMPDMIKDLAYRYPGCSYQQIGNLIFEEISENYDMDDIFHDLKIKQECTDEDFIPGLYSEFMGLLPGLTEDFMEKYYPYIKHDLLQGQNLSDEFIDKHPEIKAQKNIKEEIEKAIFEKYGFKKNRIKGVA